jgi:carbonic anhydrase
MDKIVRGVKHFQRHVFNDYRELFGELATQQNPDVLFITCSDSRIDPNLLTQSKPGDLFICRNAGNIIPPHRQATGGMTASIEYAVAVLGVRHIVICGHSDCGAMKGALDMAGLSGLPHVKNWLGHSQKAVARVAVDTSLDDMSRLQRVTEENVLQQLEHLSTHPAVAARLEIGELQLHGWVYDIETGAVCCGSEQCKPFAELS